MAYTVDQAPSVMPDVESRPKRALRRIELPAACALISALVVHLLLSLLPIGRFGIVTATSADLAASAAAVLALLTVVLYRAREPGRGR